uniref:AlNc14C10G1301 protein n=1 Tax=Albugo laibachii Nc14 TaxID=890382 RepID=F0W2R3_9STRA|nr:AlNc14C10G1301 [Albugo laibachii Nc14]|eukprot:CCA15349.1 AlNc14C10G1301 [Albugo laibachii Nc14]
MLLSIQNHKVIMARTFVITSCALIAVRCIATAKDKNPQSPFEVFDEKQQQNLTLPSSNDLLDATGIDTSVLYHQSPSVPTFRPNQSTVPVSVPVPDPEWNASSWNSTFSASLGPELNGWTRVVQLQQLEKFFVIPDTIPFDENADYSVERLVALRANRRVDFAQYTHGFIGGTQDFVGEDSTLNVKNTTLYRLDFDTNGTATFQSTTTKLYWAYKIADRKIVWVRSPSLAVRLEIYLHTVNRDAIFLKHGQEVLSFRGSLYSNDTQSTQSRFHGLAFLSIICENAIFSAAKATKSPNELNSYILIHRKRELTSVNGSFSALFAPYDLALLLPQQRPLTDYPFSTIHHPYEWFNTLFTMTQLIVQNIPEYREMYPTFGAALPHDLNINSLIDYIQLPNTSVWTRDGADRLLSIATTPPAISSANVTNNLARQEWAGLVGTMISCAWMHDFDHRRQGILDPRRTSLHTILQTFYFWSSSLVDLMIPTAPLLERLDQVFILHPFRTIGAFLEKDAEGRVWFDRFLASNTGQFSMVSELRLLLYLGDNSEHTMIGSDIISTLLNETTPLPQDNDMLALVEYIAQDTFTSLQTIAVKVCKPGSLLAFCTIQPLIAEFQSIRWSIETMYPSNKTTSLMDRSPQKALAQLIDPELQKRFIHKLHQQTSRLPVRSDFPSPLIHELAQTQEKLASYLEKTLVFDCLDRVALFNEKMAMLVLELERAAREKVILVKLIAEQESSSLTNMGNRIFDLIYVALVQYNPFAKFSSSFSVSSVQLDMQDVQQVGNYVIDLVRVAGLDRFWSHQVFNKLLTTFMRVALSSQVVQNIALTFLDPLIQPSHTLNEGELEQNALRFVVAHAQLNLPVEDSGIQELQSLILQVLQSFCDVLDHNSTAFSTCKKLQNQASTVIQSLCSSLQRGLQALHLLSEIASSILSKQQTHQISYQAPKSVQIDASRLFEMQTTSKVLLTIHRSQLFKSVVAYCNQLAYIRPGFLPPTCANVFANKPIADQDIEALAAGTFSAPVNEITLDGLIPSRPQFVGDTGFLDIAKLMNGDIVRFQLPRNITWLQQFHWLAGMNPTNVSIVVQTFDLYLLPRFASVTSKKSIVYVQVNATGLSSFGSLMNEKMVEIPSVSFANTYEERPAHLAGACHFIDLPAHTCSTLWPKVCSLTGDGGANQQSFLPSLFSSFQVRAIFPDKAFRQRETLEYGRITSPMYLTARLRVRVTLSDSRANDEIQPLTSISSVKSNDKDRQLASKSRAGQRCCPVGQYKDWMDGECRDCDAKSVSQLGGMYCVSIANQTAERRKQMRL